MNRWLDDSKARALASKGRTSSLRRSMWFLSLDLVGKGNRWALSVTCLVLALVQPGTLWGVPRDVSSSQSALSVEAYDFVEVTLNVSGPDAKNPFTDASVEGEFGKVGDSAQTPVDGFCDSPDGSVFRIRFMPSTPGDYAYTVTYRQGGFSKSFSGTFKAVNGNRRGIVRVDPQHPWHFIWSGTGEHFFWNATTTYFLMGWRDEKVIEAAIDRLHNLKINRLRVLVAGRSNRTWSEPVNTSEDFTYCLNPWPAQRPDDTSNPGFDYTRFNLPYWQKYERMLGYARERDMLFSVVFDIGHDAVAVAAPIGGARTNCVTFITRWRGCRPTRTSLGI